jgi:hypothetical protein
MRTLNSLDGTVVGAAVQAGTIHGGVHLRLPLPEPPRQLTAPPRIFVGRRAELAALGAADEAALLVLTGPAGVGKTTLARQWAHDISPRFPDGQLQVDLRGLGRTAPAGAAGALAGLLRALHVPESSMPATMSERASLYRSLTAGRALLVVLENALSATQVRALLPGAGPNLVLVTSRQQLAGLSADGSTGLQIRPWDVTESVVLLERILGPARVGRESDHAVALARMCGGLPLALAVVAARLVSRPKLPLARLAAELGEEGHRLRRLRTSEGDSVLRSLDLSYQGQPHWLRKVYRRLAALPGREYGPGPVALLAGSTELGGEAIDHLIQANLLEEVGTDRYRQQDLLYLHARQRFEADEPPAEQRRIRSACLEWYTRLPLPGAAASADRAVFPIGRTGIVTRQLAS